jgi:hypothetical protein
MDIKSMVKDKYVEFVQYREGNFIYRTPCGFMFPVPLSDIGNATMARTEKAIMFMRYIRKHMELINEIGAVFKSATDEQLKEVCQKINK